MLKHINKSSVEVTSSPENFVLNPYTNKMIKVNGAVYNKLMRKNLQNYKPPLVKNTKSNIIHESTTEQKAVIQKNKLQKEQPLDDGRFYSISNNKKQVLTKQKRSSNIKPSAMGDAMALAVQRVQRKLEGQFNDDEEYDEEHTKYFKNMILQELILIKEQKPQNEKPKNKIYSTNNIDAELSEDGTGSSDEQLSSDGSTEDD